MPRFVVAAIFVSLLGAAPAHAAAIVAPADGTTVGSVPMFEFEWPSGGFDAKVDVELSAAPEILTAGDRAGHFVDPGPEDTFWRDTDTLGPVEVRPWGTGRLDAGAYYMRGFFKTYGGEPESMTPVMRIRVRDEPIIVEGWLVRSRALDRTKRCAQRLRLSGKFRWDDNSNDDAARWVLKLRTSSKTLARFSGEDAAGSGSFNRVACLKKRTRARMSVSLTLIDAANHFTSATPKPLPH